jgi:Type IV secretion system pilin
MKIARNLLIIALVGTAIIVPAFVFAGPLSGAQSNLSKAIGPTGLSSNLTDTIATVIKGVLALVGTIFFVLTIYAGILWMTAQGNAEQVEKSTAIVKAAIIGLGITMSAYAITAFVTGKLNNDSSTNNALAPNVNFPKCSDKNGTCEAPNNCLGPVMTSENNTDCLESKPGSVCCYKTP